MVTYRKVKKDRDNKHVHNKEIQIVKETGNCNQSTLVIVCYSDYTHSPNKKDGRITFYHST